MSADSDKLAELLELAGALRQESINEQQLRRLEELIGEDAEMRGHYIIYVRMCAELRSRRRDAAISELLARQTADRHDEITEAVLDEKLWQELAESEINAPEVYVERPRSKKELPPIEPYVIQRGQKRVISRSLMYLAVISSAALLFIMLLPLIVPPAPPIVANLTKTVGAQWDSAENSFQAGDSLREGDLVLRKGTVQLYFLKGAEVIVRAPARLRLEGIGQLFMYSGNISVKVEKDCDGFLVRTAGATMVDYGTEFGVIAFEDGRTQVHVFDGVVGLRTGSDPLRFGQATRLKKGQASGVNSSGQLSGKITKAVPRLFARQIPEPQEFAIPGERIDLADIVGGGNGFGTGFLKGGIDAGTGEFIEKYQKYLVQLGRSPTKLGEYRYNQVSELPYVDGVFVPNDKAAPLEVTSQGHKLLYCPVANSVYYSKGIVNRVGGVTLNGKEYGSREHPVIAMLRNKGITFDLAAIRADIPGSRIARFNALAGISSSVLQFSEERGMRASFMVLVDGEVRFVRSAVTPRTGGIPIDLELEDTDRFLTLITAYEQVGMRNTSVFAEAALGLE